MTKTKAINRKDLVKKLVKRDGWVCQYPGEEHDLDPNGTGKHEPTIDHVFPQSKARADGWSEEEIWDLSNLDLLCKKHNARKSDRVYNDDGTLPEKPISRFRYRRQKRAERREPCGLCYSGRLLLLDEVCPDCGSGPQPSFPTAYQMNSNECPHSGPYSCWACMAGHVDRKPAYIDVFDIENTGMPDE